MQRFIQPGFRLPQKRGGNALALEHLCQKILHLTAELNDAQQFSDIEKMGAKTKMLFSLLQQLPPLQNISAQEDKALLRKTLSEAADITQVAVTKYQLWQHDIATLLKALTKTTGAEEG